MSVDPSVRLKADEAFSQARRRVFFGRILSFFTGHHQDSLLSFEQVRDKLRIRGQHYAGLQIIPLDKIAGSAGRYQEFNRAFLPTQDFIRERWKRVYEVAHSPEGFPAIDVYEIAGVYFVRDGHHRVSVLKELGATTVEATVTELDTPIPLSPDTDAVGLDLKEEYATFLEATGLDRLKPEQDIQFTLPGQYQKLYEHIAVHRHYVGLREQREVAHTEAVTRWYDEVYRPVAGLIREEQILEGFPHRTEADLYLWIIEHRHYLSERYGQDVPLEQAAVEFSREFRKGTARKQLEAGAAKVQESSRKTGKKAPVVAVFGSGSAAADHPVLAQAEQLGRELAEAGMKVMCGGYGGTMEAVSRGAHKAGGQVIGVTMDLFATRLEPNPWLDKEKREKDLFGRLKRLMKADAYVALQGGIGTLTEATLAWSLLQTGQIAPRPLILVGESWRRLLAAFEAETFMTQNDLVLATVVDTEAEALAILREALIPSP
jgi:uncharacterized protein (TIGR00730 family)